MSAGLKRLARSARQLLHQSRGNVAITFALLLPVALGAGAIAVDYINLSNLQSKMQAAADSAALAAAKEMHLAQWTAASVAATARNYARSALAASHVAPDADIGSSIVDNNAAVQVRISTTMSSLFGDVLPQSRSQVSVQAVARLTAGLPICLVALETTSGGAIHLQNYARLTATNCAVYSDSKSPQGIMGKDSAVLISSMTCSAGGKVGSSLNFRPTPLTDCPQIPDPLASRPPPPVGSCLATDQVVDGLTVTLKPGTFCGGLHVTGAAKVTLSPGVYVMKDGPLIVDKGATVNGSYAGFYLSGSKSTFLFDFDTTINLTAPKDGPLAGILMFEDRAAPAKRMHKIFSNNARTLLGTIYIPNGRLIVDAHKPIADKSAYTIIVTRTLELYAGPNLVMNTNYGGSDVPTPRGVGVVDQGAYLAK